MRWCATAIIDRNAVRMNLRGDIWITDSKTWLRCQTSDSLGKLVSILMHYYPNKEKKWYALKWWYTFESKGEKLRSYSFNSAMFSCPRRSRVFSGLNLVAYISCSSAGFSWWWPDEPKDLLMIAERDLGMVLSLVSIILSIVGNPNQY